MKTFVMMFCMAIVVALGTEGSAKSPSDLSLHADCIYCGMHRDRFAHSRMVLHYKDGTSVGVCSIFCAARDYVKHVNEAPVLVEVGDYGTKQLTDAQKAWWVIGGSKTGVMTNRPKWAFQSRRDAQEFIATYGGRLTDFDEAMKASYEDIYEDMRALKDMQREYARSKLAASSAAN